MRAILKTGYSKIMQLFYQEKNAKFHLRKIARKTKTHIQSTTRSLNQLEKENILKSEKEGNMKKYSIKKTKRTFLIFTLFDIEKFNQLPSLRKKAVKYFLERINEKPVIALIFGSTAKETYTEQSDIDLLLIVNKKIKTEKAEKYTDAQTGMHISVFQILYSEFIQEMKLKEDRVIASAVNTGYPVTNHLYYYEIMLS